MTLDDTRSIIILFDLQMNENARKDYKYSGH